MFIIIVIYTFAKMGLELFLSLWLSPYYHSASVIIIALFRIINWQIFVEKSRNMNSLPIINIS